MKTSTGAKNGRRKKAATRDKVTLSLPRPLVAAAQAEVDAGHAPSLSAYVSEALAGRLEQDSLDAVPDAMDAAYGPPTDEDEAWSRRVLGL